MKPLGTCMMLSWPTATSLHLTDTSQRVDPEKEQRGDLPLIYTENMFYSDHRNNEWIGRDFLTAALVLPRGDKVQFMEVRGPSNAHGKFIFVL